MKKRRELQRAKTIIKLYSGQAEVFSLDPPPLLAPMKSQ
jgi:hypothetical protein